MFNEFVYIYFFYIDFLLVWINELWSNIIKHIMIYKFNLIYIKNNNKFFWVPISTTTQGYDVGNDFHYM